MKEIWQFSCRSTSWTLRSGSPDYVLCAEHGTIGRAGTPEEVFEKEYIANLYGIRHGSYLTSLGFPELPRTDGTPKVFVIGGMGSGIPVYHALNRAGIAFAGRGHP